MSELSGEGEVPASPTFSGKSHSDAIRWHCQSPETGVSACACVQVEELRTDRRYTLTQASAMRCEASVTLRSFSKRERQLWRQSFRAYVNFSALRARLVSPNWGTLFFETMGLT